ncbi:GILT-like protein 1 [Macrosteles quadrilineatus]|uniref:GILT-like protein 1 n=1 Tax=Macrosteles quadrilineatus TaxID=74068 RepID=UPI0023E1F4C4|nr:GILT-like protein 1 [Macrosteles quadrilineatus]
MASVVSYIVLLAVWATIATAQEKVKVSVYFESYCPDSVKFLTKQLYPVFAGPLGQYLNLTLVPYGKATTTREDSNVTFVCHHGEKECKGNKVIACVLDESISFADQFKFINCTSSIIASNPKKEDYPVNECVSGSLTVEKVSGCAAGQEGSKLLDMYGNMTTAMFPNNLQNVPTIVFGDKFVKADHDAAVSDFRKALCSKIPGTKPAECSKNGASGLQAAILPLLFAVYVVSRV